jgi:EAL domain
MEPAMPLAEPRPCAVTALIHVRPRFDLRTGLIVSGRIDAPSPSTAERFGDVVQRAYGQWRAQGRSAPLAIALNERLSDPALAEPLHEAAVVAGLSPGGLTFEIAERALIARALPLAEGLRARGWRLAIRADNACPLPFGERVRSLYQEVVVSGMSAPSAYCTADRLSRDPFAQRLMAAREAGLRLTAEGVNDPTDAKTWLSAGFDCAEGRFKDPTTGSAHIVKLGRLERAPTALSFSSR